MRFGPALRHVSRAAASCWLAGCLTAEPEPVSGLGGQGADRGGSAPLGPAEAAAERPLLGACVESPVFVRPANTPLEGDFEFEGTVSAVGAGVPYPPRERGCPFFDFDGIAFGDAIQSSDSARALAQLSWVRLDRNDGAEATLVVAVSGFAFPNRPGEVLRFVMHAEQPRFSPVPSWLEVRDASGALALWVASAGDVAELYTPAELALSRGAVDAQRSSSCITSWDEHRLEVSLSGTPASIGSSEREAVGAYQVLNAGVLVQTGDSRCPDAYAASAGAAAWPLAASVPLTDGIGGPCYPEFFGPGYTVPAGQSCQRDSRFPLGYLTLACDGAGDCPGESSCDDSLCRAPCGTDRDCPWPTQCLPFGDVSICQCGEQCAEAWCADGRCGDCPDPEELGTTYFAADQSSCMNNRDSCPAGLERFDVLGCGCGCRLAPGASCVGELPGASYARGLGGCVPTCAEGELPYSEVCGCGCAPASDPAVLCLPPPASVNDYAASERCPLDCPDGTRAFSDACGCVCADASETRALCLLRAAPGPCLVHETRYRYDPLDDVCTPFTFGGCLGNLNNFPSREACEAACVPWP